MMDWAAYQQQLKTNIGEIAKLSPETIRGYMGLSGAGQKTDHLDAKDPRVDRGRRRHLAALRWLHRHPH